MKYGAMIVGILAGFIALSWLGLFGSIVGGVTTAFDNASGENIKALSIGLPVLAMIGGAICGAQPQLGGIILLVSAFGIYKFLGFNSASEIFIISIGAAGVLGLVSPASTKPRVNASSHQQKSGGATGVEFDHAKWNALLQYDKDISAAVESIRPLGAKWVDEFAISFLALNDKQYLPEIVAKITARARTEAEENAVRTARFEEQQKLARQQQALRAQGRREKISYLLNLAWGTKKRKLRTAGIGGTILVVAAVIIFWPKPPLFSKPSFKAWTTECNKQVAGTHAGYYFCISKIVADVATNSSMTLSVEQLKPDPPELIVFMNMPDQYRDVNMESVSLDSTLLQAIHCSPGQPNNGEGENRYIYSGCDGKLTSALLDVISSGKEIQVRLSKGRENAGAINFPINGLKEQIVTWPNASPSATENAGIQQQNVSQSIFEQPSSDPDVLFSRKNNLAYYKSKLSIDSISPRNLISSCGAVSALGLTWRVPSDTELETVIANGKFIDLPDRRYWGSYIPYSGSVSFLTSTVAVGTDRFSIQTMPDLTDPHFIRFAQVRVFTLYFNGSVNSGGEDINPAGGGGWPTAEQLMDGTISGGGYRLICVADYSAP